MSKSAFIAFSYFYFPTVHLILRIIPKDSYGMIDSFLSDALNAIMESK